MTDIPPAAPEPTPMELPPLPEEPAEAVVSAEALFQGRREVIIEHEGVRYRLRLTRRGKLILQK